MAKTVHIPLPSDPSRTVSVEPMSIGQLNQIGAPRHSNEKKLELLTNVIIPTCTGLQPGEYEELILGDGTAIMIGLHRASVDDELDYRAPCTHCGHYAPYYVDLSKLEATPLRPDSEGNVKTTGFHVTHESKGTIYTYKFHLPRVKEEREAAKLQAELESQNPELDFSLVCTVSMTIDSISPLTEGMEGDMKAQTILKHIFHAPMDLLDKLRDAREEVDCGFEGTVKQTCVQCKQEFATEIPLLESFFLPDGRRLRKERRKRDAEEGPTLTRFAIS